MFIAQGIIDLLLYLTWLFKWALILAAIVSTLISFGVLDTRNRIVWSISDFLYKVTEPALRPIRAILPSFGGVDLSPLIAILLIQFVVERVLMQIKYSLLTGAF